MSSSYSIGVASRCGKADVSDFTVFIDELEGLGLDMIELPLCELDLLVGGRMVGERVGRLKEAMAGRTFRWSGHGAIGLNFLDDEARLAMHRATARAYVELAAEIGAERLVIHSGQYGRLDEAEISRRYARQREELLVLGEFSSSHGVLVCVENVFGHEGGPGTALPGELARELAATPHPALTGTLDFSHGYIHSTACGADFVAGALAMMPLSRHLHIHDSFGVPKTIWTYNPAEDAAMGMGDLHLPPGWGSLPFDRLMREGTLPADAVFMIELHPRCWDALGETVEATRRLMEKAARGSAPAAA
ncbi:sugar phosphate isomerase/epimerase family protein [Radicibacter daui]|uniref:sugar phosphate isomerase/epimerase family protein n=1 Tax=Radicibacter daui TaxID=3064829 RepID=UPI004046E3D7